MSSLRSLARERTHRLPVRPYWVIAIIRFFLSFRIRILRGAVSRSIINWTDLIMNGQKAPVIFNGLILIYRMAILCYMRLWKTIGEKSYPLCLIHSRSNVRFIALGGRWSSISHCFYAYWSYWWGCIRCGLSCVRRRSTRSKRDCKKSNWRRKNNWLSS